MYCSDAGAEGSTTTSPCFAFPAPLLPRLLSLSITLQHHHDMRQAQLCPPVEFPVFKAVVACGQSIALQLQLQPRLRSFPPGGSCAAPLLHTGQSCKNTTPQQILLLPGGKVITTSVPPAAGGPFSSKQLHCAGST